MIFTDFCPLSGDRSFAEDKAIIGGFAKLNGRTVMVIGHEKGHDTESRLEHNFGMAKPEGYRKAQRLMDLADKFTLPVIAFVDTSGAFPGIDAEERGQAQAIASSIERCLNLKVPFISIVIGEGGSGGAIALATANKVLMLENAIYSVISPEGCASILWKDASKASQAAETLHLTAEDLLNFGIIDEIISEPAGAAHRFPKEVFKATKQAIETALSEFDSMDGAAIKKHREDKFTQMTRLG